MNSKETMFYQVYSALGGKGLDMAVEAYKQVWSNESENLKDSTIRQYCKELLYSEVGKEELRKYRSDNVMTSQQLLDQLKELRDMIPEAKNIRDELEIRKEIRHTLREISSLTTHISNVVKSQSDKYQFTDIFLTAYPNDLAPDSLYKALLSGADRKLILVENGTISEVKPFYVSQKKDDIPLDQVKRKFETQGFMICVSK